MEKFKYANTVTNDSFKKIFGLRSTSTEWNVMQNLYIYRRSSLNENDFFKFFQLKDNHFSYLDVFRNNDFTQVFHKELHYCPKCMKLGYHSYLHQLSFADTCPFHDEQLLFLRYKDKAVPYSIDFTPTEAYSAIQAREKQPAERYIDILPSKELIDGIWQIIPDIIKINVFPVQKIIFFNPSIEPSESVKPFKKNTFKLIDCLRKDTRNIEFNPVFHIDTKTCDLEYNKLLARSADWFDSKYQIFNKSNLECWFIAILIEELIKNIDKDVLQKSISNMQRHKFYYQIDDEEYLKTVATVFTAYIVTNARDLYEGIDNSIIYHYYTHNKVSRCPFSFFDIESYINYKGIVDNYIPFLIFDRLFKKLYEHIITKLQVNIELSFNYYSESIDFNVPDYVVIRNNNSYEYLK